ncbi:MAG: hypothetical protein A2729_05770 [Candidatus Buchananbacteria bacterium RIFCSPHIGHO2_01_FULL_39_14]|uniref:Uncharacterized protein n=2 Tax=Candidatus Buchananiibacteriota TaxID=1817903 RepID=A0A1G1YV55_9BACT|nr:MAG: hypothetical protein A2729_05770 [Candidatus Buchananbacteria bacterium RIFCSPHIGHO2_01_FULL_39_14]OGY48473.1 MAG: hypothetical protein A3D39_02580 [Candidatus Buchananbacteria bacterium RIFCSPHIGHO2_02_FULL_39_17]OGY55287.1 MAG: hypothetical protein A2912_02505 [Candidatus Buchananbacteria bacterium RIFCSPLOWO2_01_FULL_40_23b]
MKNVANFRKLAPITLHCQCLQVAFRRPSWQWAPIFVKKFAQFFNLLALLAPPFLKRWQEIFI